MKSANKVVLITCVLHMSMGISFGQNIDSVKTLISEISEVYGVDSLFALSVAREESNYDRFAVNKVSGCAGLFQLNPRFFKLDDYFDVQQSADWGVSYLLYLVNLFEGDTLQALTGYAYGPYHSRTKKFKTSPYAQRVYNRFLTWADARGVRSQPVIPVEIPLEKWKQIE